MKQTAVEWLIFIIERYIENLSEDDLKNLSDLLEQAKEMEKQQIMDAYEIGFADAWDDARYDDSPTYEGAEQYYNETYKSK